MNLNGVIAKLGGPFAPCTSQDFAATVRGMNSELQKPWGLVIDEARKRAGLSVRKAASAAGISEGRWRQIVNGYQAAGQGQTVIVEGPDDTVARMAEAVGVSPDQLRSAGRDRAAEVLTGLLSPITPEMGDVLSESVAAMLDERLAEFTDAQLLREIEGRMLYLAAKLQAGGGKTLGWALDSKGLLEMVTNVRAGG